MKNYFALLQVSTFDFLHLGPDVGLGEGQQVQMLMLLMLMVKSPLLRQTSSFTTKLRFFSTSAV